MSFQFTKDTDYRFGCNSLGEYYRHIGEECECVLDAVNISYVARDNFTKKEYEEWKNIGDNSHPLCKRLEKYINYEFERQAHENMCLEEYQLYQRISKLQVVNDSRFRVWGGMYGDHPSTATVGINLCTEFTFFCDEVDKWEMLHEIAKDFSGEVKVIEERPHSNKCWQNGVNGWRMGDPATDDKAIIGENHGRMERQVELSFEVQNMSLREVKTLIGVISRETESLWEHGGVSVI